MKCRTIYIAVGDGKSIIGDIRQLADYFDCKEQSIRNSIQKNHAIKKDGERFYVDLLFE